MKTETLGLVLLCGGDLHLVGTHEPDVLEREYAPGRVTIAVDKRSGKIRMNEEMRAWLDLRGLES